MLLLPVVMQITTAAQGDKEVHESNLVDFLPRTLGRQRKALLPLSVKDPGESAGSKWII